MRTLAGIFLAMVMFNLVGCTASCCGTPPAPCYKGCEPCNTCNPCCR